MKTKIFLLILICCLIAVNSRSQDAPVTTAGTILDPGPSGTAPITVTGFTDIGSLALRLEYNIAVVTVTGVTANAALVGFTADWTTTPGRIIMNWNGSSGITLPDYSHLADIAFSGLTAGSTPLIWYDNGTSCQYTKYNGGAYTVLNDLPTSDYYFGGIITWQRPGPITTAPVYAATVGQVNCLPIKADDVINIGSISLTLDYNPAVLTFDSLNTITIPGTWALAAQAVVPGRLIISGFGPGLTLPDGSTLLNACFLYHGGVTALTWYDGDGNSCEYSDAVTLDPLYDLPLEDFYLTGQVSEAVVADFTASNLKPPRNTTVHFTDLSIGGVTGWSWSFSPNTVNFENGTSAISQNPDVQFINGGLYTVTLIANNANNNDTETRINYIRAGIQGLWIGIVSVEWNTSTNWDDDQTPDLLTDVLITTATAPSNWPKYIGDLKVGNVTGDHCNSITFEGEGTYLIILGTMTIKTDHLVHVNTGTGYIVLE